MHPSRGWTDAAAGFTDALARTGGARQGRRWELGLWLRTNPRELPFVPVWAPQPCSSRGSAPPRHHSRTASPRPLCEMWGPSDLSSCLGCPCPLPDPGLGPHMGTDLAAALGWGLAGPLAPTPCALSLRHKDLPQHRARCRRCPSLPRTPGGENSLIFLNKRKYLSLRARISFPAPCVAVGGVPTGDSHVPPVLAGLLMGQRRCQDLLTPCPSSTPLSMGQGLPCPCGSCCVPEVLSLPRGDLGGS